MHELLCVDAAAVSGELLGFESFFSALSSPIVCAKMEKLFVLMLLVCVCVCLYRFTAQLKANKRQVRQALRKKAAFLAFLAKAFLWGEEGKRECGA